MSYQTPPGRDIETQTKVLVSIETRMLTKAAQTLLGICAGITADGSVHEREVQFLSTWLAEHPDVTKLWPGSEIARRVHAIMADGIITAEERADLLETLQLLAGNHFDQTGAATPEGPALPIDDDPSIFFHHMTFCFTGRFLYGTRASCERAILGLGGTAVDSISKNLNFLVIGSMIEPQWANTTYGRKIEKAVAYRDDGVDLVIVSERQWTAALADTGKTLGA
jgi:NAD-dependent DNA ligase